MAKKSWLTPTLIGTVCTATIGVLAVTGKAQDAIGKIVVESRKEHFREDHKPICDTVDSLKRILIAKDSTDKIQKERTDLTYYFIKQMVTGDQKVRAINEMNEDKRAGILR